MTDFPFTDEARGKPVPVPVTEPYALTRLDALRKLRREGYAVVERRSRSTGNSGGPNIEKPGPKPPPQAPNDHPVA